MSIFDKLMFWRHDDIPDIGKDADLGLDSGLGDPNMPGLQDNLGMETPNFGMPPHPNRPVPMSPTAYNAPFGTPRPQTAPPGFQAAPPTPMPMQQNAQEEIMKKDLELLSYKLDTLKVALDMVNQRLANIERLAIQEVSPRKPQ